MESPHSELSFEIQQDRVKTKTVFFIIFLIGGKFGWRYRVFARKIARLATQALFLNVQRVLLWWTTDYVIENAGHPALLPGYIGLYWKGC